MIACVLMLVALSALIQVPENLPWDADAVPLLGLFHLVHGGSGAVAAVFALLAGAMAWHLARVRARDD